MNNSDAVIVNVTLDLGELSSQYKNLTDGIKDLYTVFHTNCDIFNGVISFVTSVFAGC